MSKCWCTQGRYTRPMRKLIQSDPVPARPEGHPKLSPSTVDHSSTKIHSRASLHENMRQNSLLIPSDWASAVPTLIVTVARTFKSKFRKTLPAFLHKDAESTEGQSMAKDRGTIAQTALIRNQAGKNSSARLAVSSKSLLAALVVITQS